MRAYEELSGPGVELEVPVVGRQPPRDGLSGPAQPLQCLCRPGARTPTASSATSGLARTDSTSSSIPRRFSDASLLVRHGVTAEGHFVPTHLDRAKGADEAFVGWRR